MDFANPTWLEYYVGTTLFQCVRYVILCGGFYYLFWVVLREWTIRRRVHPDDHARADLIREAKDSFWFFIWTSIPITLTLAPEFRVHSRLYLDVRAYPLYWLPISFLLLVFGQDAYFYWVHRILHTKWLFKHVHGVHHKSLNPNPLTAFAMHPVEGLFLMGFIFGFVWCVPTNLYVFSLFQVVSMALNINGHFGAEFQPESWKRVPVIKHLNRATHHTNHHRFFTVNYGLYFTLWDRWMKTFRENAGK
ncbi:MAG: sterol desaturase family protein [Bdellovibrionales bacterium]|nr:sterol desaturase family protein [Bdellovibrionales bacterium]